ncbi:MAG: glycosyltransferase family 39 protein [Candidatus Andersenbacteria bacterium]|nr:glycosyltransferase family 39 protein [Candidatus Andersenbacteria bacterium]
MSRRKSLLLLTLIIIVGVGLRTYQLTARSLWFDEAFSWRLIQFSWPEMIARDAQDVHPPLYYIFLKGWAIVFGTSLLALRLFSVLAGAGSIALSYLFVSTIWPSSSQKVVASHARAAALTTALFMAVSGWQIAFAWEARMYTLGVFFTLLSSWLLLVASRQKKQRLGWWLLYGLAAAAMVHTHYYALFSLAAQGIFACGLLIAHTRGRIGEMFQSLYAWYALCGAALTGLLFAPWLPTFLRQNSQVQNQYWIPPLNRWSIPDTLYRMVLPSPNSPSHDGFGIAVTLLPLALAAGALAWLILSHRLDSPKKNIKAQDSTLDASVLVALMAVMPFILSLLLSLRGQSLYQDRYFVLAHPFILIAIVITFFRIRSLIIRRACIALFSLLLLGGYVRYMVQLDIPGHPGAQIAVRYAYTHRAAQEHVYATSSFIYFAAAHYAQEEFQNSAIPRLYTPSGELSHFSGRPILTPQDIIGPELFTDPGTESFWLIETTGFGAGELKVPDTFKRADRISYPELYGYQGDVIANRYTRR